jgi:muramoyltetrapeptide carboxypeptidase
METNLKDIVMNILKPNHLNKGDKIGVVAPSFPFPTDKADYSDYMSWYLNGKEEIEKMGFKIVEGKNLRKLRWWMAGTPQERAEDINLMYADPEVKAIIAHDGGHAAIDILEYLDFNLIKNNPKPFMGFSDITNLLVAMFKETGLVGFHMGLLSYTLGNVWQRIIKDDSTLILGRKIYFDVLTSTRPLGFLPQISTWENWKNGKAEGVLFGGNLSMLISLIGTKYFPTTAELKNTILFWETDNTESYRIQRGLYQLRYTGILDVISGMIIGKLPDIKPSGWRGLYEPSPKEIVMDIVKDYEFPILAEVDFGHKNINLPMPIGIKAKIDAEKLNIEFKESAVI